MIGDISVHVMDWLMVLAVIIGPAVITSIYLKGEGFIWGSLVGLLLANASGLVGDWILVLAVLMLAFIIWNRKSFGGADIS